MLRNSSRLCSLASASSATPIVFTNSENRLLVVEVELRQQEARVVCRGGELVPRARRDQLPVL